MMIRLFMVSFSMLAALPVLCSAETEKRPNILFVIWDDVSHAGAYGHDWVQTPAFDQLAKQGILFNNAHVPSNKCTPSRSVVITGRNPWQLEAAANHVCYFPAKFKSVWEALGEAGYFTGHTGKGWGPGKAVALMTKKEI